jgi:predicted alpha-1,2-mannosidase
MNDALPDYMVGDPVQMTIVDGYCRGLATPEEAERYFDALWHQANDVRRAWNADYLDRGWVADGASETLEYALADFSLALMADELGYEEKRDVLLGRALNYANVIDPETGFARPRNADGSWKTPYAPEEPDHFVEGTGWQYTWLAPHDLRGLFDLIGAGRGGDELVRERLDTFFSTAVTENVPAATPEVQKLITAFGIFYAGNQYAPSNEHDLHAPYLYDYAGQPWKTQGIMRNYQMLFRPTPDGMPGNDDLGSMSAWYVWSALGMYPVTGGATVYAVGSPVFESATIRPHGTEEEVVIAAPGASFANRYVQSASLGDEALERPWLTHEEIFENGSVAFEMGPTANTNWGTDPAAAPPSLADGDLGRFGCEPAAGSETVLPTTLTYAGDERGRGEQVTLAAVLRSPEAPLEGATIEFAIAGRTFTAVTDADGTASVVVTVPDHGKTQTVTARFAGDDSHEPSSTAATVTWGRG